MKTKIKRIKKISGIWTLFIIPTLTLSAIAGATYFVIKNSRSIQKEYWSVEKFNKAVNEIKIENRVVGAIIAKDLLTDFNDQKEKSQKKLDEYFKKYPEIKDESKVKKNKNKYKKIIENKPKPFDANLFLNNKINNRLDFEKTKFLDFRYIGLEEVKEDKNSLRVHFEIYLNYKYATGVFETNKIKSTPNSKYYFKSSQIVKFLSNDLKTYQGSEFLKRWSEIKKEAEEIIKKYDLLNKQLEKEILSSEQRIRYIEKINNKSNSEIQEINQLRDKINNLKEEQKKVFTNISFQNEIFNWFIDAINKTDAFPDIYPENNFKIIPGSEKDNDAFVTWNPKKGLNELKIVYKFENKTNKIIKSESQIKIFTLEV
ncbi:hypothetical protein [Metamycoplasma canadense]|uniref:Uncharacterized protein n=1 Tax=Metamycoplasma canadense TaxID=29554 RepID=A0A077L983_9BACT|nr:hypothetical protein [Metamycoplasma canadense]BAP39588.1 hypothetical protein MCAN360_0446 [Metamycoplasma canadense]